MPNGNKQFIVTYKDEHLGQAEAARVLEVQPQSMDDGIQILLESEPQTGRVMHFEALGTSVLELSDEAADNLRHDSRVAEVVEDIEVFALGDCKCGGGASGNSTRLGGNMGGNRPVEVDPYAAGYQQALFDMANSSGNQMGDLGSLTGPVAGAAASCPPGYQRRCFRWHPFFPPFCFCVPGGPPPGSPSQAVPWHIQLVKAEQVWSRVTGRGVKVAIIDTGIDNNHPDLSVSGGASFVPGNPSWDDDQGHGTHCAGIAAARNNTVGVVGVAPEASLYAVKVLSANGSGQLSWILAGMSWAAQNNMDVASMSLGSESEKDAACIVAYQRAAQNLINNGCIVIAAAGNSGRQSETTGRPWVGQPARCSGFMAVAAVDQNKNLADFSSRGPDTLDALSGVEISAPGVSIRSTVIGGGYGEKSGTSMACPHVAGAAALLKELHPTWSPAQIRTRLKATAADLGVPGTDPGTGAGLLDCHRAVFG